MSRLIDADRIHQKVWNGSDDVYTVNDVLELIDEQPTIDAIEVVRCGECRYRITAHGISDGWVLCSKPYTERGNAMHRADWFCADGERRCRNDNT